MTLPLRLVVFDCDGTLVDSEHGLKAAMNAAWHNLGLPPPPASAARAVIGLSLTHAIDRLAPQQDDSIRAKLADVFVEFLHDPTNTSTDPLFPGVVEVLDVLAADGVLLGVATGKGSRGLRKTLQQHGLTDRFVTLQTADRNRGKPDPEMLHNAMAETGVLPEHTMMIGDTVYDVEMARNAGVAPIGVSWGYHAVADLRQAGARVVIDSFDQLLGHLSAIAP